MGDYKKSKSGKWIIGWNDRDRSGRLIEPGKIGYGEYALYNVENNVTIPPKYKLDHPTNGCVANDGTFCIEDCDICDDLPGVFYVFSKEGDILLKKNLPEKIYKSGISESGLFAACYSDKLYFFDIANKKELFSIHPPTGWGDRYEFDENKRQLIVHIKDLGKFRYESNGVFIDNDKYQQKSLNSKDYFRVIPISEKILSEPNVPVDKIKSVINSMIRLRTVAWESIYEPMRESYKPQTLKIQGLAYEMLGEYQKAATCFEESIKLNPKIGLKRKLALLKKRFN